MRNFLHLLPMFLMLSVTSLFGQFAPNFTVTANDGAEHKLYEHYLDAGKTVMIEIMFTTCPPCNSYAPYMEMLYNEWGSGKEDVQFFTITDKAWDTNTDMLIWGNTYNHSFPGVGANGGALEVVDLYTDGTFGFFFGTPTFIIIAPDRSVQFNVGVGASGMAKSMILSQAIAATGAQKPPVVVEVGGTIKTISGDVMHDVNIEIAQIEDSLWLSDSLGAFHFDLTLPQDSMHQLVLSRDGDPLNGVTTYDMVLITKHILNVTPFDDPLKEIAADVNLNGVVSTSDLVKIRKLVLFIDFTMEKSWRFVDGDCDFNSQTCGVDEVIDFDPAYGHQVNLNLTGLKVGDVNNSANWNGFQNSDDRSDFAPLTFTVQNQNLEIGEEISVPFKSTNFQNIAAYQGTFTFDQTALQLIDFEAGAIDLTQQNFNLKYKEKGFITTQWMDINTQSIFENEDLFYLNFKVLNSGQLSDFLDINSDFTKAKAYTENGEAMDLNLEFENTVENEMNIFPNPTSGNANIQFQLDRPGEVLIEVWNMLGQKKLSIQREALNAKETYEVTLPTNQLSADVYFLNISSNGKVIHTQKLIKV